MTSEHVKRVRAAVARRERAERQADEALAELHAAIADAAAAGVRQRELVELTGYTRERVRQIGKLAAAKQSDE